MILNERASIESFLPLLLLQEIDLCEREGVRPTPLSSLGRRASERESTYPFFFLFSQSLLQVLPPAASSVIFVDFNLRASNQNSRRLISIKPGIQRLLSSPKTPQTEESTAKTVHQGLVSISAFSILLACTVLLIPLIRVFCRIHLGFRSEEEVSPCCSNQEPEPWFLGKRFRCPERILRGV